MIADETCIGCGLCIPYCPMNAISLNAEKAEIDQDECVECGACLKSDVCPTDSLVEPELEWPRTVRRVFSDSTATHVTDVAGRGTEEMKTNDVTGRYRVGEAGFAIDVGRPGIGTRLRDVEKIYKRLVGLDVQFEDRNPVRGLLKDEKNGDFKEEVLNEKVLSAIIEFKVPSRRLEEVLCELEKCAREIDTVFSIGLIDKISEDGSMQNIESALRLGYLPSINAKVCVGIGRPQADF